MAEVTIHGMAQSTYLDETFGGTRLQPSDPVARARMNCWISMFNDSFYQTVIRDIVLPRFGILRRTRRRSAKRPRSSRSCSRSPSRPCRRAATSPATR